MNVIVVGSGPSGIHFALTAVERGHKVTVIDVGKTNGSTPRADLGYVGLKRRLPDPTPYFLGDEYEGAQIPMPSDGAEENYYNISAAKNHVFERSRRFSYREQGLSAFHSFAAGGLAEAWTAGAYAFNDDELRKFPFGYQQIAPFYAKVSERIGVGGKRDEFGWPTLVARYTPPPGKSTSLSEMLKRVRRFLWNLRAPLIPGMARVRPMGASAHYSGTLPMTDQRQELTVSANGQSHDFGNMFVVDGSIFPFLPAKNLTFILMASATGIASNAF
jgi:hypothetical protein